MANSPTVQRDHPTPAVGTAATLWDAVAPAWERSVDFVEHRARPVTDWLMSAGPVAAGARVLDVGCGPGGAGLAAAEIVGPAGHVVLADVSPRMTEVAARRARERGLAWVSELVLDAGDLGDQPGQDYDVVLSRDGIQFAADPQRAFAGLHHVLRPGGHLAVAVWASAQANPWLGLLLQAVADTVGRPVGSPTGPGPFALADPVRLRALVEGAGFVDVRIDEVPAAMRPPSVEQWVDRASALSAPVAALSRTLPTEEWERVRSRAVELAQPFIGDTGLALPGLAVLASARRRGDRR